LRLGKRAALVAVSAGLLLSILIPGTAWAPRVKGLPGYVGPCTMDVNGVESLGVFVGDIFVLDLEGKEDDLHADLSITGSCRVGLDAAGLTDAQATSPVTIEKANCKKLHLRLGDTTVRDITIDLSGTTMDSTGEKADKAMLCAIAKTAKRGSTEQLATLLNAFFAA
jgi:hypothetical protein